MKKKQEKLPHTTNCLSVWLSFCNKFKYRVAMSQSPCFSYNSLNWCIYFIAILEYIELNLIPNVQLFGSVI